MARRYESPVTPLATATPSRRDALTEAADRAAARALRRFLIAQTAGRTEGTLREKRAAVAACIQVGFIAAGPVPCLETVRELAERWEAGEREIANYEDGDRCGRPRKFIDPRLETMITNAVDNQDYDSVDQLAFRVMREAARLRVRKPSYYAVKIRVARLGVLRRSAARHGRNAAVLDGIPSSTVPADYTHDVYTLDELTLPFRVRVFDPVVKKLVAVKPDVVLVQDYKSRATVGYLLADPSRRTTTEGSMPTGGVDTVDVLGALMSAACPELAPPATVDFAGRLCGSLRWDNHKAHKKLSEALKKVGIEVKRLPGRRPKNRGVVEALVDLFKQECAGITGHVDLHKPVEQLGETSLEGERTAASAGGDRVTRKTPILVDQLLDMREAAEVCDRIIRLYNDTHVCEDHGLTPREAFTAFKPRQARTGRDLLHLPGFFPAKTTRVRKEGIVHIRNKRKYRFACEFEGWLALLGKEVTYRIDPLLRGIFVRTPQHGAAFLPPLGRYAREKDEAEIAQQQSAPAALYSDLAAKSRELRDVLAFGLAEVQRRDEAVKAAKRKAADGEPADDAADGEAPEQATAAPASTGAVGSDSAPPAKAAEPDPPRAPRNPFDVRPKDPDLL
jgi:hypothetical protein